MLKITMFMILKILRNVDINNNFVYTYNKFKNIIR